MFNLRKKPRTDSRRPSLLAAIPVQNRLVRVALRDKGLRLTAPLKPNALRKIFASRNSPTTPEKSFDLDDLGAWLWNHLDGKNSVEAIIHQFAADHRVNLRESEVAIVAFLKTLTQRNLIALVAPPANPERAPHGNAGLSSKA